MRSLLALFSLKGAYGATSSLFTVAREHVGNEEAWPATPDATVHIPRAVPEIESVTVESDGQLRISALGAPGVAFVIEASIDLVEWRVLGSAAASGAGVLEFVDNEAAALSHRFYRLRGP